MRFMHAVNYKQVIGFIAVSTLVLGATLMRNQEDTKAPSADVQALDAKLLNDLKQQELQIDPKTAELMATHHISENDLRTLFDIDHLNYGKCEAGNCHYTSYTIEGKLDNGKEVMFKLDSGEDGNTLRDLTFH